MKISASQLRANMYRLLDQVLESGAALEIERKGRILQIIAKDPPSKLARLPRRDHVVADAHDDLVHVDWSGEWER